MGPGSSSKANAKQQEITALNAAKGDLETELKELRAKVGSDLLCAV